MTNVLGRPVTGDLTTNSSPYDQKPGEEFLPLLDAILELDNVESIRWTQYTPYFNDGDPCMFGTGELFVKLVDGDDTAGDEEDGYISAYDMTEHLHGYGNPPTINPGCEDVYAAMKALNDQFGHFEDFLIVSFGDHAQVTATSDGFDIAFYEHD